MDTISTQGLCNHPWQFVVQGAAWQHRFFLSRQGNTNTRATMWHVFPGSATAAKRARVREFLNGGIAPSLFPMRPPSLLPGPRPGSTWCSPPSSSTTPLSTTPPEGLPDGTDVIKDITETTEIDVAAGIGAKAAANRTTRDVTVRTKGVNVITAIVKDYAPDCDFVQTCGYSASGAEQTR